MSMSDKLQFIENCPFFIKSPNHGNWIFQHDNKTYIEDDVLEFIPIDHLGRYGFYLTRDRVEAQEVIFNFLNHVQSGGQISKREFGLAEWILSSIVCDLDDARPLPHKKSRVRGVHRKQTIEDKLIEDKKFIFEIEEKILSGNFSQKNALLVYIENNYPPSIDVNLLLSKLKKRLARLRKKHSNEWWYPKKRDT